MWPTRRKSITFIGELVEAPMHSFVALLQHQISILMHIFFSPYFSNRPALDGAIAIQVSGVSHASHSPHERRRLGVADNLSGCKCS
jgi:hypothetical protein